jgi:hypothetical protein
MKQDDTGGARPFAVKLARLVAKRGAFALIFFTLFEKAGYRAVIGHASTVSKGLAIQ